MEKKQNKFVLAIIVIAVIMNLVTVIMIPFQNFSVGDLILTAITSIEHLAVLYYVLFGYKRPHGNMLRYVMLLFALSLALELIILISAFTQFNLALSVAKALCIPYIAGRLNKIEQNKVLMPLVLILFLIDAMYYCVIIKSQSFIDCYRIFGQAIEWFAISAAYFVRYKEHREAGLADAPKK